jgi:UDP-N-acetylglucosamine diphosphorylase / glucose-1-phosphate thymidylyltransferase / UDP-N-acetylgalactosamine diphosphorylase / glucosamine-1-phosphate N-acetyltransferase / galactosamine-1-phosphate N-acetyltransferase
MQAVILAAGKGTRMGELTKQCPKPMLQVLGRPILEWKLALLPSAVEEVIMVVGYLADHIHGYFGTTWGGRRLRYVEQTELHGTGGTLPLFRGIVRNRFLLTMGDDLYHPADLAELAESGLAVLGFQVAAPRDIGLIETDATGRYRGVREHVTQAEPGLVNTGAYLLDERLLAVPPVSISETEYGLPQTLAVLGQSVPVSVRRARAWQPVSRPEDLLLAEEFLRPFLGHL